MTAINAVDEINGVKGSRGKVKLGGKGGGWPPGSRLLLILVLGGVVLSGLAYALMANQEPVQANRKNAGEGATYRAARFERAPLAPEPEPVLASISVPPPPAPPAPVATFVAPPSSAPAPRPRVQVEPAAAEEEAPPEVDPIRERKLQPSGWTTTTAGRSGVAGAGASGLESPAGGFGSGGSTELQGRIQPARFMSKKAAVVQNPRFRIPSGTGIPCVMQTQLVSIAPGLVRCIVSRDVMGMTGELALIPRGTTITGSYGIEEFRVGDARLFVTAAQARIPISQDGQQQFVEVDLDSLFAGPLGASGIDGHVDNRWAARFGLALAVSLTDDLFAALLSGRQVQGDENQVSFTSTGDATQELALEIARGQIDIRPVLSALHGKEVIVQVTGDLDFSSVYRLELRR